MQTILPGHRLVIKVTPPKFLFLGTKWADRTIEATYYIRKWYRKFLFGPRTFVWTELYRFRRISETVPEMDLQKDSEDEIKKILFDCNFSDSDLVIDTYMD